MNEYQHRERLAPEWRDEFVAMDAPSSKPVALEPVFSGDAFIKAVPFPVIVESWDKKLNGRAKRRYLAEFTEAERKLIGRYQTKFRRWYLVSGVPHRVMLRLRTLELLQRAVAFFASI